MKFDEDKFLEDVKKYIESTYSAHYSDDDIQMFDLILAKGRGVDYCVGNIIKYADRFECKANGEPEKDIFKIVHYAAMLHLSWLRKKEKESKEV